MKSYVADFESTTNPADCRVWAYAICEVGNKQNLQIGSSINSFFKWCEENPDNSLVYFHNLKWDGNFIISWLLNNGFKHTTESSERASRTFSTLINSKGQFYSIEVIFKLKNKRINKVTFRDSLKLIPMSVEEIAKTFKMPYQKLEIDYAAHNNLPEGAPLSEAEKDYIKHDVLIVATAIEFFYEQGLNKMTIGACALAEYKKLVTDRKFNLYFPEPKSYHNNVKSTYKGGWCYVMPEVAGKTVGGGFVLDKNSLYPYVMKTCLMPYGTPIFFRGDYQPDERYPLYIIQFQCEFELKPGKLPTLQSKEPLFYKGSEYLTSSDGQIVTLTLNSVDYELFREHYRTSNFEVIGGWKFRGAVGLFDSYIDKWNAIKIKAKEENNPGLYLIAKLMLNSLYGKFGTSNIVRSKIPKLNDSGAVKYSDSDPKERKGIYIALASYVTAYGRQQTINAAQSIVDDYRAGRSDIQFLYSDTDSLHILSPDGELPSGLDIDDSRLGAWKIETRFKKARYLRQKCYIQETAEETFNLDSDYYLKVVVAGMPSNCSEQVNFKNFKIGATYTDKKQPQIVPGGVILNSIDFTIKR